MSISITIIDSIFIVLFSFVQGYICHRSMAAENIHSKTHRELTEWYTMFPNNQWDIYDRVTGKNINPNQSSVTVNGLTNEILLKEQGFLVDSIKDHIHINYNQIQNAIINANTFKVFDRDAKHRYTSKLA